MIINKIENYHIVKIQNKNINIYNTQIIEELTKKILHKINKKNKIGNYIHIEIYQNNNYGIIIKIKDYNSPYNINNDKTVKITIHTDAIFLYQIDYFNIKKNKKKINIYYYKNKFYLELKEKIDKIDYIKLLELSEIIYEEALDIIDKGIKI